MKLRLAFTLIYCCLFSISAYAQKFKVIHTLKQKPVVVNVSVIDFGLYSQKDTTININPREQSFLIPFRQPQYIYLTVTWDDNIKRSIRFLATEPSYNINADRNQKLSVGSSTSGNFQYKYENSENHKSELLMKQKFLLSQIDFRKSVKEAEIKVKKIKDSISKCIDYNNRKNYEENLDNVFGLYSLCRYAEYPLNNLRRNSIPDSIELLLNRLDKDIQNNPVAIALKGKLNVARSLLIGRNFDYNISLIDTLGEVVHLSQFKNKFLLIDFWATWCVPCRMETPYHLQAYRKYRDKNFQILSINLDDKKLEKVWLETINKDKSGEWVHFSDFDHLARTKYNIRFIPANILVNEHGVIVGKDLRGEKLQEKLQALFKN